MALTDGESGGGRGDAQAARSRARGGARRRQRRAVQQFLKAGRAVLCLFSVEDGRPTFFLRSQLQDDFCQGRAHGLGLYHVRI